MAEQDKECLEEEELWWAEPAPDEDDYDIG